MKLSIGWLVASFFGFLVVACPSTSGGDVADRPDAASDCMCDAGAVPDDAARADRVDASPRSALQACEAAGTAICKRACACSPDDRCAIIYLSESGAGTFSFQDEAECLDLFMRGCDECRAVNKNLPCPEMRKTVDYARCQAAMETAACVSTSSNKGVAGNELCVEP